MLFFSIFKTYLFVVVHPLGRGICHHVGFFDKLEVIDVKPIRIAHDLRLDNLTYDNNYATQRDYL